MGLNPSCNAVTGRAFPVVGDGPWKDIDTVDGLRLLVDAIRILVDVGRQP
jgi:hypothetical protein